MNRNIRKSLEKEDMKRANKMDEEYVYEEEEILDQTDAYD